MKLMVRSWDSTGPSYNAEAEETAILDYSFGHGIDEAAEFQIILSDPTGSIFQKYKGVAAAVYCGPGKATIEDPDGTDVFFGRITKAIPNTSARTLTLFCQDWLSQLDDEQIDYDMREDLDGAGLRESTLLADSDSATYVGAAFVDIKYAVADDGGVQTDETTEANNDTADDMTLLPLVPVQNDAYYFGFASPVKGMNLYVSQAGDWAGDTVWEYWHGSAWITVVDGPSGAKKTFEAAGSQDYTWTPQSNWAETAVNGLTAYWVRCRVTTIASINTQPLGQQAQGDNYVFDDDMAWANDAWNGYYFIIPQTMTGRQTASTGPYRSAVDADTETGSESDVWIDDTNDHNLEDNDPGATDGRVIYYFRLWHTYSTLYVADSISGMRVKMTYKLDGEDGIASANYTFMNDGVAGEQIYGETMKNDDRKHSMTWNVPAHLLTDMIHTDGTTASGHKMYISGGVTNDVSTYFYSVEVDFETTGYSSLIDIRDTINPNKLCISANLHPFFGIDQIGGWNGMNYCIAQEIFKHIASDEARGTLITGGDDMETLTCTATIEHTSGVSTRQYIKKTRLEILQDLRLQDKAHIWIPLGSTTVTWKSTFNDGAPETLTDADVEEWMGTLDALAVANKYIVQGARIGDSQLESTYEDATSINYYNATRTRAIKEVGLISSYDTLAKATALTEQHKDARILLTATIDGNTINATHDKTIVLGDEISITSTYLGLTASVYVVQRQEYDTRDDQTRLTLHPRASTVGMRELERKGTESIKTLVRRGTVDNYVPSNASDVL